MLKNKKTYQRLIWFGFYFLVFSYLVYNSFNYLDPDLGWHLIVGQEIMANGNVPHNELYNYTLEGKNWVDHEWGSNLITYFIFDKFGYIVLTVFFALIIILAFFIVNYFILRHILGKNRVSPAIMAITAFGVYAISPHIGVRMQGFTILFLAILLALLFKFDRTNDCKKLYFLPLLFILWANLHAGFLIGLFILVLYFGMQILELIIEKYAFYKYLFKNDPLCRQKALKILPAILLAFLATLLTPYGIALYGFLFEYTNTYYLNKIIEWLPQWSYPIVYRQLFYLSVICAVFVILIRDKNYHRHELRPFYFLSTFLFLILSFKAKRNFPLFFFVSLPVLAGFVKTARQPIENKIKRIADFIFDQPFLNILFITIIFLVSVLFLLSADINPDPFKTKRACAVYPCAATDYLKNSEYKNKRLFNNYSWGGYSLWTWPEKKLFIDGRLPIKEFKGHTLLEEYHRFFNEDEPQKMLDEYSIEAVIIKLNQPLRFNWFETYVLGLKAREVNEKKDHLRETLVSADGWRLIFSDRISEIYVR